MNQMAIEAFMTEEKQKQNSQKNPDDHGPQKKEDIEKANSNLSSPDKKPSEAV